MPLNLVERVKGFLMNPVESFQKARGDTLGDTFTYFIILLVIYAILATLVSWAMGQAVQSLVPGFQGLGSLALPILFVITIIIGIVGAFIGGAWLHLWVYIFGGRKGISETLKTVIYATTPTFVIGWIPLVSIIGALWTFCLLIIGLRETQEIKNGGEVFAVVIAIVIPIIIFALIAVAALAAFMSMGGVIPPTPY